MLIVAFAISLQGFTIPPQEKKLTKDEKKKQKEAELVKQFKELTELVGSQRFVFTAESTFDGPNGIRLLNPFVFFIDFDSTTAFVQLGRFAACGLTTEGTLTWKQVDQNDQKKEFFISTFVSSGIANIYLFMTVDADGSTDLTVSDRCSYNIVIRGKLLAPEDALACKRLAIH
jgi:hypothetical protein